jgi:hypothetical protein
VKKNRALVVVAIAVALAIGFALLRVATAGGSPNPLAQAEQDVADRVIYVERTLTLNHVRLPHDYAVSLAAMGYVVGHVSAPQYGYLRATHQPLPRTAAEALEMQAGICGNAATTMLAILGHFHVPARRVNVYYSTPAAAVNGHTTVEVWYGEAWHWFDPTWGTIYVRRGAPQSRVLSLLQVLRLPPAARQAARLGDDTRLWNRTVVAAGPGFGRETGMLFLTIRHLRVAVGAKVIYRR